MSRLRFVKAGVVFAAMTAFFVVTSINEETAVWRVLLTVGAVLSAALLTLTAVAYGKMHR